MGRRRKRGNSDVDESLEEGYFAKRHQKQQVVSPKEHKSPTNHPKEAPTPKTKKGNRGSEQEDSKKSGLQRQEQQVVAQKKHKANTNPKDAASPKNKNKNDNKVSEQEGSKKWGLQVQKQTQQDMAQKEHKATANPKDVSSPQNNDKNVSEQERSELLRLKKQQRKEFKKAKIQNQKKQQQETRKKEQEKKQDAAKRKKDEQEKKQEAVKRKKENAKTKKQQEATTSNFITIRKGVQYRDTLVGKGPVVPDRKKIRVAYTLRAKNRFGKILDSSDNFGFRLGRGEVIDGWDMGVQGMRLGGTRYLIVPPEAGYGGKDIGAGPGATLFFEVTVVGC